MKPLKIVVTVLMCLALLAAEGLLMGLFTADNALSEKTIKKSMAESDVIEQLVDEAIAENTVNMGGIYGEFAKEVFRTEVMEDFFVDYLTSAVNTEIYGKPYEEVAYDELTTALVQAVEEVNSSGMYNISQMESNMIIQAIKAEAPTLTAAIDEQVNRYEAVSGSLTEDVTEPDELIKTMMSPAVKAIAAIVCVILCVGILAICWENRLGFVWCALCSAAVSAVYGLFSLLGASALLNGSEASPSEQMIVNMITGGAAKAFMTSAAVAILFLVVFGIVRAIDRRKSDEQIVETAECAAEGDR